MSVSKMLKLTVIAPTGEADTVLQRLMKLRAVSLRSEEADAADALQSFADKAHPEEIEARIARIETALPVLTKYSKRRRHLLASQIPISPEAFCTDGRYDTATKVVEETNKILTAKQAHKQELEELAAALRTYTPYLALSLPVNHAGTETAGLLIGCLPGATRPEQLRAALSELPVHHRLLSRDATGIYLAFIYHRSAEEDLLRALSALDFVRAPLPAEPRTVRELHRAAQDRTNELNEALERLESRLSVLSDKLSEVEVLCDIEHTRLLTEQHKQSLSMTQRCVVLRGWCPVSEQERIETVLSGFCAAFSFEEPAEGEEPPVLLKNGRFAQNFEWVLGMYAYPKYGTFDPTLIMSIFYMLIFGLMFADAGYGLVLSLVCFSVVRWTHPRDSMKRFLLMFGYCGISCTVFGILFGSYFGNFPLAFMENVMGTAPEQMPRLSLLPAEAANVAVLLDPIQNPMGFLLISLGMGALHLLAGMAVKAFVLCRRGKVIDALCDVVLYWVLFAGLGTVFFHRTAGILLLAVGVGGILLTHGRSKKGIAGKAVGGFLGLYELINYASDLLSYSRILALGLAAGVIGQVVNILATLKGASFIGILLMLVVFCIGHLLNLVINILGTFVHTSRLQYIEFFNKFYEEGGTPFRPMAPADRYTRDVSNEMDTSPAISYTHVSPD